MPGAGRSYERGVGLDRACLVNEHVVKSAAVAVPCGSAIARLPALLLRLLGARLAALASPALPGDRPAHWAPTQPLPRVLERAASKATDLPAFDPSG